jgi:hypothetical protein
MLKANSLIRYQGHTWYPGQEIQDVPEECAARWLKTGEAVGNIPMVQPGQETDLHAQEDALPGQETDLHAQEDALPEQIPEDISQLTISQLRTLAKKRGISVPKTAVKSELIEILEGTQL